MESMHLRVEGESCVIALVQLKSNQARVIVIGLTHPENAIRKQV